MRWRGPPGGYYRRAARSPLFISMFSGLSLLFACFFSPPAAILFSAVVIHSFYFPLTTRHVGDTLKKVELTPSQQRTD